jgi:hypothetical protein
MHPPVRLRSLHTIVPDTVLVQDEVRDVFASQPDIGRLAKRNLGASVHGAGSDSRHTDIDQEWLAAETDEPVLFVRA